MKKKKVLVAWIGRADLTGSKEKAEGTGPIHQALSVRTFDSACLLCNYSKTDTDQYESWLASKSKAPIEIERCSLPSPTDYEKIYLAANALVERLLEEPSVELTFHLSPGTPAMAVVWTLIAARCGAKLIDSSKENGVRDVVMPFSIMVDFVPAIVKQSLTSIESLATSTFLQGPEFSQIIHRCAAMKEVIARAQIVATTDVPVLILGETGTGKDLLANAIHKASNRKKEPFIAVNCGAIPKELIESELFGHVKGAFTGATSDRKGHIVEADGGTLFLDEIGELPLYAQVKLLRVLQEHQVVPVGATKPVKINARILCATHKNLLNAISSGEFREDLFQRIAVGILHVPALRERGEDIGLLLDSYLKETNEELAKSNKSYRSKKLSVGARKLLLHYAWPGNIRELKNTLVRAALWGVKDTLEDTDIQNAFIRRNTEGEGVLGKDVSAGVDIEAILGDVARHYLNAAMKATHSNKTKAAALLGLKSQQRLSDWLKKYDI